MKTTILISTISLLTIACLSCKKEINITNNNDNGPLPAYISDTVSILNDTTLLITIRVNGEGVPTTYFTDYGTSQNSLDKATKPKSIPPDSNSVTVMDTITTPLSNTNYYYQIHLSNSMGTRLCPLKTFNTGKAILPLIISDTALSISGSSAVFSGKINPRGLVTTYHFEYGISNSYGNTTTEKSIGSDSVYIVVGDSVFTFLPNTLYHYRIVASNNNGKIEGFDKTFATPNVTLPSATLWQAKDITTNSATLEGWVHPNGKSGTYYFEYGETPLYGVKTSWGTFGAGLSPFVTIAMIDNLHFGTQYHWRIHCLSDSGEAWSDDGVFTTVNIVNPVEFSYPLTVGTTLTYDYYYYSNDESLTPPVEVRKGIRLWKINSTSASNDSTIYYVNCTVLDTILTRVEVNMPPDTSYDSESIPFTIVFTQNYIYVGFDKIVMLAGPNKLSPIVPIPRIVQSGTAELQLGDETYINGIGLKAYAAREGSITLVEEHLILQ